ncbi:MAG TPA: hypothetical protein VLH94_04005 [Spirochaetia bacterium]|nr:hypothetical protein [Spirochaetia bacterium]
MPNDDLGTFPLPPQTPTSPTDPDVETNTDNTIPPSSQPQPNQTDSASPTIPESTTLPESPSSELQTTPFEETPEEIPSIAPPTPPSADLMTEQDKLVVANEELIEKQKPLEDTSPLTPPEPISSPVAEPPAALPSKSGSRIAPIIIVILLIIAGLGLASAAYLSAQTSKLRTQLEEITQTIQKQENTVTPTPSPTVFEVPTPTIPPTATESSTATPSATPTVSLNTNTLQPLANASSALKIAINKSPNAQLILIKVDNAIDPATAVTKYFFRQDLTTKKYFYVAITGKGIPEIIDKQIYVTPDDNIPSLNDTVLTNSLGIDLDETLKLTYALCANQTLCTTAPIKAQYIKTGSGIIWQISLYAKGLSTTPLMLQMDAETKTVLYKSPEFANK